MFVCVCVCVCMCVCAVVLWSSCRLVTDSVFHFPPPHAVLDWLMEKLVLGQSKLHAIQVQLLYKQLAVTVCESKAGSVHIWDGHRM